MNTISSNMMWQLIMEKLEKGEDFDANFIIWNYISGAGTRNKEDWLGNSAEIEKRLAEFQQQSEMNEDGFKSLYDQQRQKLEDAIKSATETRDRFKKNAKTVLKQIRESKVNSVIKKGIGDMLNNYAEMLDTEIQDARRGLVDFETWKRDFKNVLFSQIPYLREQLKEAKKNEANCQKILNGVNACFSMPEGFKW